MRARIISVVVVLLLFALLFWAGRKFLAPTGSGAGGAAADAASEPAPAVPAAAPLPEALPNTFYVKVDLSSVANSRINTICYGSADLPVGDVLLGGVPFSIPVAGRNAWTCLGAAGTARIEIPVNVFGAYRVDTLINNFWGRDSMTAQELEFFGDKGAHYSRTLVGGVDIRDWNDADGVNTINNTTTTAVWTGRGTKAPPFDRPTRLDKQGIMLPAEFKTQTLTKILLTDTGSLNVSRCFIGGVTVSTQTPPKEGN